MVQQEDLHIINEALNKGFDVEIQNTKNGYRIISKAVKVLKKTPDKQNVQYGFSDKRN